MVNLYQNSILKMKKIILRTCLILFPFCIQAQSPGGVSLDLNYWLRADAGTTTFFDTDNNVTRVSDWGNQTPGSTNGVSQTPNFTSPIFNPNALNFNPALFFDGNNDAIFANNGYDTNTQIVVFNPTQVVTPNLSLELIVTFQVAPGAFADSGIGIGNLPSLACEDTYFLNSGDNDTTSPEYLACLQDASFSSADPFLAVCRENATGTLSEHRLWGADKVATINNPSEFGTHTDRPFTIGSRHSSNSFFFEGDIVEVISYSSRIAATELQRIESYLALKYGLTLDQTIPQNYLNSEGNVIYDTDGAFDDYDSNIAGIGRDDASGLNQKQSRSSFEGALVTIGNGSIAEDNASNTNNFDSDLSFLVWGHNGDSMSLDSETTICLDPPGDCGENIAFIDYMPRTWRVQNTEDMAPISLSIPATLIDHPTPVILISEDNIFENFDTLVTLEDDGLGNLTTSVNIPDGYFFTFGLVSVVLDLEEQLFNSIQVSPNPVQDYVSITSPSDPITSVNIYDLHGRLVKTISDANTNQLRIDLSALQNALYLFEINTMSRQITKKVLRQD